MKYCLTTLYNKNFESFAPMVTKSFSKFCKLNDWDLVIFDKLIDNDIHPSWNKLLAVKKCFGSYDGVLWCDADSLFTGKSENFINTTIQSQSFVSNWDANGLCLSHFYMTNNDYNNRLIDTLLFLKDVNNDSHFGIGPKWEQNTLKALTNYFNINYSLMKENTVIDYIYHNRTYPETYFYHFSVLDNRIRYSLINLLDRLL